MDTNCCTEATACHADPACDPAFDCNTNCGDDATCRARCTTFFTRAPTLVDLTVCRESTLQNGVRPLVRRVCLTMRPAAVPASARLVAASPATAPRTATASSSTSVVANCLAGSSTCPPECEALYPGGTENNRDWVDCVGNSCSASCASGHNWSCIDAKPRLVQAEVGRRHHLLGDASSTSSARNRSVGSLIKACSKTDLDCSNPIDTQTTNADGPRVAYRFRRIGRLRWLSGHDRRRQRRARREGRHLPGHLVPIAERRLCGMERPCSIRVQRESRFACCPHPSDHRPRARPLRGRGAGDYSFAAAGGVTFDADDAKDSATTVFYFVGGVPRTNAIQTDSQSGIGGYINLKGGRSTLITARVTVDDVPKPSGPRRTSFVRALSRRRRCRRYRNKARHRRHGRAPKAQTNRAIRSHRICATLVAPRISHHFLTATTEGLLWPEV